ncbi:MAG: YncE family protein [Candidatus Binatia bacterium]
MIGFVPVGTHPNDGIAVTPDGAFVYVANNDSHDVSVISTATNTAVSTIGVSVIDTAMRTLIGTIRFPPGEPGLR